MIHEADTCH